MAHRILFAAALLLLTLGLTPERGSGPSETGPTLISAARNLSADPWGRVVDIRFDRPHALNLPHDALLFEVDLVRPLARDASFCVYDLDGDGLNDLLGPTFSGTALFFPGVDPERPYLFGAGQFVRRSDSLGNPFDGFTSADWQNCAVADLDGDGNREIVVGRGIYSMVTPQDPTLVRRAGLVVDFDQRTFLLDPFVTAADWDGDGDTDILMTDSTVPAKLWLHRNQSTPGNLVFEEVLITNQYARDFLGERGLSAADFNGDGLFDLICFRGIYFNGGQPGNPQFDFNNPNPFAVEEGPWVDGVNSDQGISIFPVDADGDGLLDVFVSNYGTSVWQGAYYRNIGAPGSPVFRFQSPILAHSAPYDHYYRGHDDPSFSGERPLAATGDPDRDGRLDLLVTSTFMGEPLVLWNRVSDAQGLPAGSGGSDPLFSYQDYYSFPTPGFPDLAPRFDPFNPYWLRDGTVAWRDFTGDGLEDLISEALGGLANGALSFYRRTGFYPIRFASRAPLQTRTGQEMRGLGWAEIDVDGNQTRDVILGVPPTGDVNRRGQLDLYLNADGTGMLDLADPQPLLDDTQTPIDVGSNAWPVALDWDGDGDDDLLIGNQAGELTIFLNQQGLFQDAGLVSIEDWDPVESGIIGGGLLTPSLATGDLLGDSEEDLVMGDSEFAVIWLFENRRNQAAAGAPFPVQAPPAARPGGSAPDFGFGVASVARTIPGRVEKLAEDSYRLYFGIPVLPGETSLFFYPEFGNADAQRQEITQQLSLYFPFFRQGPGRFTGFAGSAYSDTPAGLRFVAYEEDGDPAPFPANPAEFDLAAGTQLAYLGHQIFGLGPASEQAVWIEAVSDNPEIGSFFQFGTSDLQQLDGSVALTAMSPQFYFTRVFDGPGSFRGLDATTRIIVANPTSEQITVVLTLFRNNQGTTSAQGIPFPEIRFIPPKGFLSESVSEMFGGPPVTGGYIEVEVQSGRGAVGFQTVELATVSTVMGLNPSEGSTARTFYSAQFASGDNIFTNVNVINTSFSPRELVLTAVEAGGQSFEVGRIGLAPGEQRSLEAADLVGSLPSGGLFPLASPFVGSLRVEADGAGVLGDVLFGDPSGARYAAALPLQSQPFRRAVFSHVANVPGFFTGLAFHFPGSGVAEIRIEVFAPDGTRLGEGQRTLQSGQRLSELLTQIVPASQGQAGGFILIISTEPIIGQLLFGSLNASQQIRLFSAVPPAIIL